MQSNRIWSRRDPVAAAVALALLAAGAAPARAATEATITLEEVLVTAQKRAQREQDVPLAITAISSAELQTRGIEGIADINSVAPNVTSRSNPGTGGISSLYIRGAGQSQPAIWIDPPIGVYLDGVYLGKTQGSMLDVVDIERVEVLRGPQGTLFGRNTAAGAIHFISRQPSGELRGAAEFGYGDYDHSIARLTLDLPRFGIATIGLAARKEVMDGWARNLTTGEPDLGAVDKEGFRGTLRLEFSDRVAARYAFDYGKADNTPPPTSLFALSGWGGTFPSVFGATLGTAIQSALTPYLGTARPDAVSTPAALGPYERSSNEAHSLTLDFQVSDTDQLKYIFALREMDYADEQSINGAPLTSILVLAGTPYQFPWGMSAIYDRITDYEQTSHELQWTSSRDRLNLVAGLYWFEDEGTTRGAQFFSLFGASAQQVNYAADTEAKAIYGQLDYRLTDRWTLTTGLRYTEEERNGWSHVFRTAGFQGAPGTDLLPYTEYSEDFSGTTPMAALAYRPSDNLNFFARVARGFKSGGFSSEVINAAVTTPFEPEFSTSYELGFKSSLWDGRARLNATLFHTKLTDQQVTNLIPGTTQSQVTNAGEGTRQGFELEGRVRLADGWTLHGGYGWLDAEFDKYLDNSFAPGRPLVDTASNRIPGFAPKHTLGLGLDGRLLATGAGELRLILDYSYTSSLYLYSVNKDLAAPNAGGAYSVAANRVPAISNLNARLLFAGIPIGSGELDLSLLVRNASDEDKMVQGIDFSMFRTANWQAPRTYLFTANYRW